MDQDTIFSILNKLKYDQSVEKLLKLVAILVNWEVEAEYDIVNIILSNKLGKNQTASNITNFLIYLHLVNWVGWVKFITQYFRFPLVISWVK